MTTIAFKDNILAADTQITEWDVKYYGRKIEVLPDGRVVTSSGNVDDGVMFVEWLVGGRKRPPMLKKGFEAIVIEVDGTWHRYFKDCLPIKYEDPVFSCGSGWAIARTAMLMGLDAVTSVKLAGEIDNNTNSVVDYYNVKTKKLTLTKFPKVGTRIR